MTQRRQRRSGDPPAPPFSPSGSSTPPTAVPDQGRRLLLITHAAPEDNDIALWLAAKLALAGYRVWFDLLSLRGGEDFWASIERMLREQVVRQIVVVSRSMRKGGVMRELSIGDATARQLKDPNFFIPVRVDDLPFSEMPPELMRCNALDAKASWQVALGALVRTLEEFEVFRDNQPEARALRLLVEAREQGRRFIQRRTEELLSNWFPIEHLPPRLYFYGFDGTQAQMRACLEGLTIPHVPHYRLAASFYDPPAFQLALPMPIGTPLAYEIDSADFIAGGELGPMADAAASRRLVHNLLRQHFAAHAKARGLIAHTFADRSTGWYFPDGCIEGGWARFVAPSGEPGRRRLSGKFRSLRWHMCLIARPRLLPVWLFRLHANLILTENGEALDGERIHRLRRRLTRNWWNDVWRDRLLAAAAWLAEGGTTIEFACGSEDGIQVGVLPLRLPIAVSYEAEGDLEPPDQDAEEAELLEEDLAEDDDLDEIDGIDDGQDE